MLTAPRHGQICARAARQYVAACVTALLIFQSLVFTHQLAQAAAPLVASNDVVISQIYGGGGNTNATYSQDFIELFNRGAQSVSLGGYSVQYSSAGGNSSGSFLV
ncbi:MAG: lamin tail domain-containing protein, partial [Pyrinomonadaceae bacterium]